MTDVIECSSSYFPFYLSYFFPCWTKWDLPLQGGYLWYTKLEILGFTRFL